MDGFGSFKRMGTSFFKRSQMLFQSDERAKRLLEKHNSQNCCMRSLRKYRDNMPMGGIKIALFDYED